MIFEPTIENSGVGGRFPDWRGVCNGWASGNFVDGQRFVATESADVTNGNRWLLAARSSLALAGPRMTPLVVVTVDAASAVVVIVVVVVVPTATWRGLGCPGLVPRYKAHGYVTNYLILQR